MVAALLLAQIDAKDAAEGLGRDFLPWAVVGLVGALIVVCRVAWSLNTTIHKLQADGAAALLKSQAERTEREREHAKELRDLLFQLVPLSTKMTESLEILERLTDRVPRHA